MHAQDFAMVTRPIVAAESVAGEAPVSMPGSSTPSEGHKTMSAQKTKELLRPSRDAVALDAVITRSAQTSEILAERGALEGVLKKTEDVQQKVEAVVDDLGSTNRDVKKSLDEGAETLPAGRTLADGVRVESAVKEVSDDLHNVNDILLDGIDQIKKADIALVNVQVALEQTEVALEQTEESLVAAQHKEQVALQKALHDSATGLAKRELFNVRLTHAIAMAERHSWTLAVMFVDLDHFKDVNDTHGHAAGDLVLKEIAKRFALNSREEDTVCRT
ncbi:MAG: GGDEF domain-containing protein, partial [Pseudomonadota bacterium]|nr:GGDEF domain-containing protein [Pseudomonadota bacterium]